MNCASYGKNSRLCTCSLPHRLTWTCCPRRKTTKRMLYKKCKDNAHQKVLEKWVIKPGGQEGTEGAGAGGDGLEDFGCHDKIY